MSSGETHFASPITPSTTSLPRLLCLHGGGVTAEIFFLQLRQLLALLSPHFRLVFADGPFFCEAGPGMIPVFAGMGPYRRWLRWLEKEHPEVGDEEATEEVEFAMKQAMEEDEKKGGRGVWVGCLGFSQGAKIAASVLYDSQLRLEKRRKEVGGGWAQGKKEERNGHPDGLYGGFADDGKEYAMPMDLGDMPSGLGGGHWRFAVLLAGRAPLVKLSELSADSKTMCGAGEVSEGGLEYDVDNNRDRLVLPTVHVHGLQDPGLHLHKRLRDGYTEGDAVETIEWDGGHRVPLKKTDNERVAEAVMRAARRAGVLPAE